MTTNILAVETSSLGLINIDIEDFLYLFYVLLKIDI